MNPVQKAISDVKFTIPPQILNQAFSLSRIYGRVNGLNLDSVIRDKVINARVMPDCDNVGGVQMDIPLYGLRPEEVSLPSGIPYSWALIYRIPMALTQGRLITRVLFIANSIAPISGSFEYANYNGSALANAAMGVMQAAAPIPASSTARTDIIAPNTIMISDTNQWPYDATMRVYVANDPDMTLLPGPSIPAFSKLVQLAVRSFIYNTLIIDINAGELQAGQELGRFKEVVDSYADAETQYQEFLVSTWKEVAALSDPVTRRDFTRIMIPAGI